MELTTEQREAADAVVKKAHSNGLGSLGGYAGTGKTTILSQLDKRLSEWNFVAYTGKAACNLCNKGIQAATIH